MSESVRDAAAADGLPATSSTDRSYAYYKVLLNGRRMPCAFIDVDLFDANIATVARKARGKQIRIASKSVRCAWGLQRVLDAGPPYQGIMAFHPWEAVHLSHEGFDDILIGYPFSRPEDIRAVCDEIAKGKRIVFMVDSPGHVETVDAVARETGVRAPVCIDVDMSLDYPRLHFGVWRSPVRSVSDLVPLVEAVRRGRNVSFQGIMGYEAQVAGLPDRMPGRPWLSPVVRYLKRRSVQEVAHRRRRVLEFLETEGLRAEMVNGGGTGSLDATASESAVTEVTVGSAFYAPTQFDNYEGLPYGPAAGFALEIVRKPKPHIYTCAGGGYTASGSVGQEKLPAPYLPRGASLIANEGTGEVQTPVRYSGSEVLNIGDPILFRHHKAGELCERFNVLILLVDGRVMGEVPTYRGQGRCFM